MRCWQGLPQAGNLKQKTRLFPPKKVLSQRLGVVLGEGEELLNHFPQILPQSEGDGGAGLGDGGVACCLSPLPTVTVPKPPRFAPKRNYLLQKKTNQKKA